MSEVMKDPTMRLFGKTIQLAPKKQLSGDTHHNLLSSTNSSPSERNYNRVGDTKEDSKKPSENELSKTELEDSTSHPTFPKESKDPATSRENPKTPSLDKENDSSKDPKTDEQSENSISQEEKALKKPEKIIPCPRCNSMDTKFCYYNNYNVSQPRHFCKNCQRYWTAGGTMRNVPVGSGRRKNKGSSASHYPHITVSEALQVVRSNTAVNGNGIHHPNFSTNGTVLNFGSDSPVCESMTCASDLAEKSQKQKISVSCGGNENGDDDYSSRSSITASDFAEKGGKTVLQETVKTNFQSLPPQVQCFPGQPWPCHWNSPSGFPITFYPAPPYWGCAMPGSWNLPWISPPPNSSTLGKHSRDGDVLKSSKSDIEEPSKENNSERGIWIPKTLRIDDPSEAAKSSIWSTLGIKNEKSDSIKRGSLFKAFQSKGDEKKHVAETTLVMQANPAALSRSLNFHERA